MRFRDRGEAGQRLAQALQQYRGAATVVLALPRGGVVLGAAVAKALGTPLGLAIVRKIGHPENPEYAICAIAESGVLVCNEEELAQVDPAWFAQAKAHEQAEARRRHERYLHGTRPPMLEGKTVILVDDGIATGLTMRAAIRSVQRQHPAKVVVAVPVAPPATVQVLEHEDAEVVALDIPAVFLGAVGAYYEQFPQVSDEEVVQLLQLLHTDPMRLFHIPMYGELARKLAVQPMVQAGDAEIAYFPNDEMYVTLGAPVRGETCVVLGSLIPPPEHLLQTGLLCHTLKSAGAARVRLLAPYLGYLRQEADEPGRSQATLWAGAVLHASGVITATTVDVHSHRDTQVFGVPLMSISIAPLFARQVRETGWDSATLVAPDEGALVRAEAVHAVAKMTTPLVTFTKERTIEGVRATMHGTPGHRAVVVDDILDTGGTLLACCAALQQAGVREILILVTHGLFTGDHWHGLWNLGVTRICCTDTVPLPAQAVDARIQVLSVYPLLVQHLQMSAPQR